MDTANTLLARFKHDGAVFPMRALSEADAELALKKYRRLCTPESILIHGENRLFNHLLHPWVSELVSNANILGSVRELIGPNVLVWVSEFNAKAPRSDNFFPWHQDLYYWRFRYDQAFTIPMVTVWIALSNSCQENGGVRVIPASHSKLVIHKEDASEKNLLTKGQTICVGVDESHAVHLNLLPGEFSIHHPLIYHASTPNRSDQPRIGLVVRYMAPEIVPPLRPAYAWLVSGEDTHGNWDHLAPSDAKSGLILRDKSIEAVCKVTGARFA